MRPQHHPNATAVATTPEGLYGHGSERNVTAHAVGLGKPVEEATMTVLAVLAVQHAERD